METASLELPTINIGMRQKGREKPGNVIDVLPETAAISDAIEKGLSADFRNSLKGMTNPYGDGHASEKIAKILADAPLGDELLIKRAVPPEDFQNYENSALRA